VKYIKCTSGYNPSGSIVDLRIRADGIAHVNDAPEEPISAPHYHRAEIELVDGFKVLVLGTSEDLARALATNAGNDDEVVEVHAWPVTTRAND